MNYDYLLCENRGINLGVGEGGGRIPCFVKPRQVRYLCVERFLFAREEEIYRQ